LSISRDTDGDGRPDAVDPEPLTQRTTRATDEDDILAAALGRVRDGWHLARCDDPPARAAPKGPARSR